MPANFLPTLRREIEELEAELESDPRFAKLKQLREVLALYEGEQAGGRAAPTSRKAAKRQSSESRQNALRLALDFMLGQHDPVPTKQIFAAISERGAELPGRAPVNNLSAMLSNSPYFDSQGRAGWLLSEEGMEAAWHQAKADEQAIELENDDPATKTEDDDEDEKMRAILG